MTVHTIPLDPGFELDRFVISHVIDRSASAITYRVTDRVTGSPFLLREFAPAGLCTRGREGQLAEQEGNAAEAFASGVARFVADSTRAASLHHPGIATTARWFKANGTAYRVLPWQEGASLASLIREGRTLSAPEALSIALPLLDALEYLHAQDIVHQELTPASVHVLESGGAILLGTGTTVWQMENAVAGPWGREGNAYAAIEQFKPELKTGPWTDIYGLSATLYHAVTGTAPPTALQRWEAAQSHGQDPLGALEPPPGDDRAWRDITALISRGLVLQPASRPQSMREWRARISGLAVAGKNEPESPAVSRPGEEGRRLLPAIVFGMVLIAIAVAATYLLFSRSNESTGAGESTSQPAGDGSWTSAQETERWRQALEANAVVGYRKFMEDFPQSMHNQQAQDHIDQLEDKAWEQAAEENTKAAYEAHLAEFPQGRHATEALARIEEINQQEAKLAREREAELRQDDADWERAQVAGNLAGLDEYILAWPGGAHIKEARKLRQDLQYQINDTAGFGIAARENTIAAYRSYIGDFPDGRHVSAAQAAIENLTLRPGKTFRDCSDCPQMVVIPAGAFWQGSAEGSPLALSIEKPRRRVVIAEPFAAGIHEVTMAQWDVCAADGGCDAHPDDNGWGRGSRPVIMVSWNDAMQYAGWISAKTGQSYSLPSESQWEYFARAGEEGDWLGGDAAAVCQYGNIAGNETSFDWRHKDCGDGASLATTPVGSYRANAFGLFDVIGNVAEWTLDCMNLSYLEAPADGSAWSRGMCSSRMTRGGSWITGSKESRLSARFNLKNGDRNDFTGFRLVRRVEKQ